MNAVDHRTRINDLRYELKVASDHLEQANSVMAYKSIVRALEISHYLQMDMTPETIKDFGTLDA